MEKHYQKQKQPEADSRTQMPELPQWIRTLDAYLAYSEDKTKYRKYHDENGS
jgi:hypothetical protein